MTIVLTHAEPADLRLVGHTTTAVSWAHLIGNSFRSGASSSGGFITFRDREARSA